MNKTETEWIAQNISLLKWWNENYPDIIKHNVSFPIPHDFLKYYYYQRVKFEHPTIDMNNSFHQNIMNTYDYALDYFLTTYDTIATPGKTWLDLTIENLPKALRKTGDDLTKGLDIVITGLIVLGIGFLIYSIKK